MEVPEEIMEVQEEAVWLVINLTKLKHSKECFFLHLHPFFSHPHSKLDFIIMPLSKIILKIKSKPNFTFSHFVLTLCLLSSNNSKSAATPTPLHQRTNTFTSFSSNHQQTFILSQQPPYSPSKQHHSLPF